MTWADDRELKQVVDHYCEKISLTEPDRQHLDRTLRLVDTKKLLDEVRKVLVDELLANSAVSDYHLGAFRWTLPPDAGSQQRFVADVGRTLGGLALMLAPNRAHQILDVSRLQHDRERLLNYKNADFTAYTRKAYQERFEGALCLPSDSRITFTTLFPESSPHTRPEWGRRLGGLMKDPAFTTLERSRYEVARDTWCQQYYCNLEKLSHLDGSSRSSVEEHWKAQFPGGRIPQDWTPGSRTLAAYMPDETLAYSMHINNDKEFQWAEKWIRHHFPKEYLK
ncbi:hypothetical protein SAMN05216188_13072 [Lentzea xinjiangensis]|uniref:Uncharacterized protein n=1 Tax=Lentzea xinjiangensis TaxID=402600 RepID=A0A1H9W4G1_9PSEU|nr:hypothetical protein [Lentzea xinjiangensis]SES28755.1 hypothetical protein SAMN05216188_13072 [Lentzea xinjiangensis]